ncbi:MAG: hypothetical protein ACI3YL_01295, partial [Prevotella sp.]
TSSVLQANHPRKSMSKVGVFDIFGKLLNPFPGIGTAMFLLNIRKKAQTLDGNRPRVALHSHRLLYICQRAVLGIYKSCTHNFTFIRTISYKGIKIMNCATIH